MIHKTIHKLLVAFMLSAVIGLAASALCAPARAMNNTSDPWTQYPNVNENGQRVNATYKQFAVGADGSIYYAYLIGKNVYLRKYDSSSQTWIYPMANHYFNIPSILTIHLLAVAPDGTPYLTVWVRKGSYGVAENVYKYSGGTWVSLMSVEDVRMIRFSQDSRLYIGIPTGIMYVNTDGSIVNLVFLDRVNDGLDDFAIAPDNTLYSIGAYYNSADYSHFYRLKKYANGSWMQLGPDLPAEGMNLQISGDGTVYIAEHDIENSSNPIVNIVRLDGSTFLPNGTLEHYSIPSSANHFFYLGSDNFFYMFYDDNDGYGVYKGYDTGTKWLKGPGQSSIGDSGTLTLTPTGEFFLDCEGGENDYSTLYSYAFHSVAPSITDAVISSDQSGANPVSSMYLGSTLYMSATIETNEPSDVWATVYNSQNQIVATISKSKQLAGRNTLAWDGRATADNTAGLQTGAFAPAALDGKDYAIQLSVENSAGKKDSQTFPLKIFSDIPSLLSQQAYSPLIARKYYPNIAYYSIKSVLPYKIETKVYDADNHVVAIVNNSGSFFSGYIQWDGRATDGNDAGLTPGELVPCSVDGVPYTFQSTVSNDLGSVQTQLFDLLVKKQPPTVGAVSSTSPDGNFHLGIDQFTVYAPVTLIDSATVKMLVYDSRNQLVVCLPYQVGMNCTVYIPWDGTVPVANGSKIRTKQYVPASDSGTDYTIKISIENDYGSAISAAYPIKIFKKPTKPSIAPLSITPSGEFTPGGSNVLEVGTTVTSQIPALVELQVTDASNRLVAKITRTGQSSGAQQFAWDGKATSGNTAGLPVGQTVPVSSSGTVYNVYIHASNIMGNSYSASSKIKLYSNPTISGFSLDPTTFTANQDGSTNCKIGFKINHVSNVDVKILDSAGRIVAIFSIKNAASNAACSVQWNGKAMDGNTAGLSTGDLVPQGTYSIQIVAGGTVYNASKKITVNRS